MLPITNVLVIITTAITIAITTAITIIITTTTIITIVIITINMLQVFRIADLSRLPDLNINGRTEEEKEKRLSFSCEFNTLGQLIVIIILSVFLINLTNGIAIMISIAQATV